jgi:hypothetical protein
MKILSEINVKINKELAMPSIGRARRRFFATTEADLCSIWNSVNDLHFNRLLDDVRFFYEQSQMHCHRTCYQNAIAHRLGLDPDSVEGIANLWEEVAKACNVRPTLSRQWVSGYADPDFKYAALYWPKLYDPLKPPVAVVPADPLAPLRMGIARSLTFIAVYPPSTHKEKSLHAGAVAQPFRDCWSPLRRHPCYVGKKRQINQHALDSVKSILGHSHWVEPHTIGDMKRIIESGDDHPYALPWLIFKFATAADIRPIIRRKQNEHRDLWDENNTAYHHLWRTHP